MANELKYHMNMLNSIDRKVGGPGNWTYIIDALNSIDQGLTSYIPDQKQEIADYVEQVIASIPPEYSALKEQAYNAYPTGTLTGNTLYFDDGADGIPVKELIVNLEPKQSGSGDPSPSNVRPISGYDGVSVKRTGKNLLKVTATSRTINGVTFTFNDDGSVRVTGASNVNRILLDLGKYKFKAGQSYIVNGCPSGGGLSRYSLNIASAFSVDVGNGGSVYTPTSDVEYAVRIDIYASVGNVDLMFYPMLRLASVTDSTFEPYQGQEYSITFPSSVGTVYSGRLNVTTGELKVDRLFNQFTSAELYGNYGTDNKPLYFVTKIGAEIIPYWYTGQSVELISNYFVKNSTVSDQTMKSGEMRTNASSNPSRFYFRWDDANSLAEVNSAFATTPLQIVAELATPITYQLTPTEVSTLLGSNSISSDGSMELTYRADTTTVINKLKEA